MILIFAEKITISLVSLLRHITASKFICFYFAFKKAINKAINKIFEIYAHFSVPFFNTLSLRNRHGLDLTLLSCGTIVFRYSGGHKADGPADDLL